jgi:hypothetical protein
MPIIAFGRVNYAVAGIKMGRATSFQANVPTRQTPMRRSIQLTMT